ncbi:hypothetical protein CRI94_11135 [Longibacter salinarum]|uniref:Serine aminopeptidase S33 domain-containing protein n=1 Tax=Longibacter salinarum TaxID=1850348 RepID=A0A2A8CWS8_9BACT|nr:alpha/beta fold hydrolase [Longibacter salinarum]PEN13189.1 hypothetical protein CRI94_11135 [Longibacter salinarum]
MRTTFPFSQRLFLFVAGLFLIAATPASSQEARSDSTIAGAWSAEEAYFRPVIRLERSANGSLVGFLADRADQMGAPFSKTRLRGDSLFLQSDQMGARFHGAVSLEEQVIQGTWTQGDRSATLTLTPIEKGGAGEAASTTSSRPQHPDKTYPYRTEEVKFKSDAGGVELAGTLSRPDEDGPHPAVVLLHGTGRNDRDYEHRGLKFFHVLADHLTRRGFAVLRYDMRGAGESGGHLHAADLEDLARDAASALSFLKEQPGVDATKVGLIGHSMGGMIAPWVHNQFEEVAFLALLAPPSVTGYEVLVGQNARLADATGASAVEVDSIHDQSRRVFDILRSDRDSADVAEQLRTILGEKEGGDDRLQLKVEANTHPWFRDLTRYDPRPALRQVNVPILVFFGGQDLGVLPRQNAGPMRAALVESPSDTISVRTVEGLNHFLRPVEAARSSDDAVSETTIAPEVLAQLSDWVREVTQHEASSE